MKVVGRVLYPLQHVEALEAKRIRLTTSRALPADTDLTADALLDAIAPVRLSPALAATAFSTQLAPSRSQSIPIIQSLQLHLRLSLSDFDAAVSIHLPQLRQ